jgi:hypothetical protein
MSTNAKTLVQRRAAVIEGLAAVQVDLTLIGVGAYTPTAADLAACSERLASVVQVLEDSGFLALGSTVEFLKKVEADIHRCVGW